MELTTEALDALLAILKEHNVAEFQGMGFSVRFSTIEPFVPAPMPTQEKHNSASMWDNPNLWPGGSPPKFNKDK